MDAAAVGARLASSVVAPLVKKLFAQPGGGAGLVSQPVKVSGLVSFRGEKRTLGERELQKVPRDDLVTGLAPESLTCLWLRADRTPTWEWLSAFPRLHTLLLDRSFTPVDLCPPWPAALAPARLRT